MRLQNNSATPPKDSPAKVLTLVQPRARPAFPIPVVDPQTCTGCGSCNEICPMQAITVAEVATIDVRTCASCGVCIHVCPEGAIRMASESPRQQRSTIGTEQP
jgi:ferredoxin